MEFGLYPKDDAFGYYGAPIASWKGRRAQIEEVIRLLEDPAYDYCLALVGADAEEYADSDAADDWFRTFWLVKHDQAVVVESWLTRDCGATEEVDIEIHDSFIAGAFALHFIDLWDRIPSANKDKIQVIGWLQGQLRRIDELAAQYPDPSDAPSKTTSPTRPLTEVSST